MNLSVYERRRLAVLAVVSTIIILLVVTLGGNSSPQETASPSSIAATTTSTPLKNSDAVGPLAEDASKPVNLDGPLSLQPNGQSRIAYPGPGEMKRVNAKASYRTFPSYNSTICYSAAAPLGAELTVIRRTVTPHEQYTNRARERENVVEVFQCLPRVFYVST